MKPTVRNIIVKPKPRDKVLPSGIIIPDTASKPNQEWGEIVVGHGEYKAGMHVLYFNAKCFEKDEEKIVSVKKIIYCE